MISLQYHDVSLKVTTRGIYGLLNGDKITCTSKQPIIDLFADYYYLDIDERTRFAQVSHEYLIEQVQRESGAMATNFTLNLNHPVKELIWVNQVLRELESSRTELGT